MEPDEIKRDINQLIQTHRHDGVLSQRIEFDDIEFYHQTANVISQTIGTAASNYDAYYLAEKTLSIIKINFSAVDALAANNTNYITFTITNLGQAGSGSAVILGTETTRISDGSSIAAGTKRTFTLSTVLDDLKVVEGDRLRIRAAVSGTLANTVTFPVYLIQLTP